MISQEIAQDLVVLGLGAVFVDIQLCQHLSGQSMMEDAASNSEGMNHAGERCQEFMRFPCIPQDCVFLYLLLCICIYVYTICCFSLARAWLVKEQLITKLGWPVAQPKFTKRPEARTLAMSWQRVSPSHSLLN